MQSLMKFGDRRNNDWKCCFCCHVRTGTIFLGMWQLMLHVICLSILAVLLRNHELLHSMDEPSNVLPTPLSEVELNNLGLSNMNGDIDFRHGSEPSLGLAPAPCKDRTLEQSDMNHYFFYHQKFGHCKTLEGLNFFVVVMFFSFAITLLMVYGAVKGKPSYLMPYFCLQMFDFCVLSLTAVDYLCYFPDMHEHIAANPHIPFQKELLRINPPVLSLLVLVAFTVALLVKTYFIGVVLSCYKYLTLRAVASRRTIHYIDTEVGVVSQSLLNDLPDYETATKKSRTPPPPYQASFQQPSIPASVPQVLPLSPSAETSATGIGEPSRDV